MTTITITIAIDAAGTITVVDSTKKKEESAKTTKDSKTRKKRNYKCSFCGMKNDHYRTTCEKTKKKKRVEIGLGEVSETEESDQDHPYEGYSSNEFGYDSDGKENYYGGED